MIPPGKEKYTRNFSYSKMYSSMFHLVVRKATLIFKGRSYMQEVKFK